MIWFRIVRGLFLFAGISDEFAFMEVEKCRLAEFEKSLDR